MNRYCNKTGVALIPWAPLATGALCRPAADSVRASERSRVETERIGNLTTEQADVEVINRVEEMSKKKGWTMAQIALTWSLAKVTAPIVGISSVERLKEMVDATEFELSEEEQKYLEEPYRPKPVRSFPLDRTTS